MSRRRFAGLTAASFVSESVVTAPTRRSAAASGRLMFVGTYTPNGAGIYSYRLESSGALTRVGVRAGIENPSWLAVHPDIAVLYAVSEVATTDGEATGTVSAFAYAAESGELTPINTVRTRGATPTHLSVHPSGRYAFVANYTGGSVTVLPLSPDGRLAEASDVVRGASHDEHDRRSLVHMVAADPSGRFILANDAGRDQIYVWRLDIETGKLVPAARPIVDAAPGSAPRHFAFHPAGRVAYDLSERDSMLGVYAFDPESGDLQLHQRVSTLPVGFAGSSFASEVVVSADGRFVYAANRLHDTIALFSVASDGRLTAVEEQWVHADYPRSIALDPSGAFVLSCNQRSDSITIFERDSQTGKLRFTGRYEPIGSPACVGFALP